MCAFAGTLKALVLSPRMHICLPTALPHCLAPLPCLIAFSVPRMPSCTAVMAALLQPLQCSPACGAFLHSASQAACSTDRNQMSGSRRFRKQRRHCRPSGSRHCTVLAAPLAFLSLLEDRLPRPGAEQAAGRARAASVSGGWARAPSRHRGGPREPQRYTFMSRTGTLCRPAMPGRRSCPCRSPPCLPSLSARWLCVQVRPGRAALRRDRAPTFSARASRRALHLLC